MLASLLHSLLHSLSLSLSLFALTSNSRRLSPLQASLTAIAKYADGVGLPTSWSSEDSTSELRGAAARAHSLDPPLIVHGWTVDSNASAYLRLDDDGFDGVFSNNAAFGR